jgi:hypothetical protein
MCALWKKSNHSDPQERKGRTVLFMTTEFISNARKRGLSYKNSEVQEIS